MTIDVDCPACGAACRERSGGEQVTVVECPACTLVPLWLVGLQGLVLEAPVLVARTPLAVAAWARTRVSAR